MTRVACTVIFSLTLIVATGCDQPDPDAVRILGLNKISGTEVEAEIETLVDGQRTNLTLIDVRFEFFVDVGEEPTVWSTETSDWLPGEQGIRLVSAGLDAIAIGVDGLQTFDRIVVSATAWVGDSDVVEDEQTYYLWQDDFQLERPASLRFDLTGLPVDDGGRPVIHNNTPLGGASAPFLHLELTSPRRVDTVADLQVVVWEGANVQAWFGSEANTPMPGIDGVSIPAGGTVSDNFLLTGPLLPGFSQSLYGPQWDGTTDQYGQGSVLTFVAQAKINGDEIPIPVKVPLVDAP